MRYPIPSRRQQRRQTTRPSSTPNVRPHEPIGEKIEQEPPLGKAEDVPELDLPPKRVVALAENNDNRLHVTGHNAGGAQPRRTNRR